MSSADKVAHIDGQLMQLFLSNTRSFRRSINPKVIKPSNPFENVCAGFYFNNIFCAATNFGCIDSFLLPQFQKRRNDG